MISSRGSFMTRKFEMTLDHTNAVVVLRLWNYWTEEEAADYFAAVVTNRSSHASQARELELHCRCGEVAAAIPENTENTARLAGHSTRARHDKDSLHHREPPHGSANVACYFSGRCNRQILQLRRRSTQVACHPINANRPRCKGLPARPSLCIKGP